MAQFTPKLETAITSFHIAYSIYFRSISNILAFILEDVKEISKFFLKIEISECSIFKLFSSKGLKKNNYAIITLCISCNFQKLLFMIY